MITPGVSNNGDGLVQHTATHGGILAVQMRPNYLLEHRRSAVAGWLASRTLEPRVVRSNPGLSVSVACVPGRNTLPLIARVFSDRTLKPVGPFYLVSVPAEVKDPTRVI